MHAARRRWKAVSASPAFLIAALVLGVALMFGAPLLLAEEDQPATSHETPVAHDAPAAEEHAAGHEAVPGEEGAAAHHEEGAVHPPTLVSLAANIIENSYRKGHLSETERHALGTPHAPEAYLSPTARTLVTFQAPIFSLLVAILLCTVCIGGARAMQIMPGRLQNLVEMVIEGLDNFIKGVLGPGEGRYVPFFGTLFLYIYVQNVFGLVPLMFTPTSVLSTTAALALVVFVYVQFEGIRRAGILGYLRHMAGDPRDPVGWAMTPLMFPLHVVGELAKPISLSLRLFGNMMGEETLIAVFLGLGVSILAFTHLPIGFPLHIPFIFLAMLTTLIQALVFMLLSTIYMALVLPHHEHEDEHEGDVGHPVPNH